MVTIFKSAEGAGAALVSLLAPLWPLPVVREAFHWHCVARSPPRLTLGASLANCFHWHGVGRSPPRLILKMETRTLVERSNFFSIKYSKSDKRTLIICFNGVLASPLERSLGNGLSPWAATKCEEP